MKEIALSISGEVESGKYFREAEKWYFYRFMYPACERSAALILAFVMLCITVLALTNEALFSRSANFMYFGVHLKDTFGKHSKLLELPNGLAEPDKSLARYLVSNYIKARESYNYSQRKRQFYYMWNNSSADIYKSFTQQFDPNNPFSLLNIWRDNYIRTVEGLKVSNIQYDAASNNGTLQALWQVSSLNQVTGETTTEEWSATVEYFLTTLKAVVGQQQELRFQITSYHPNKLR